MPAQRVGGWLKLFHGALLACALAAPPVYANEISLFRSVLNTDFATAGTGGLRGTGTGTISVDGVAGAATLSYLYWHGPTNSTAANANADVTVNGAALTGTNIGFSSDNLWSMDNSQAYRANSTSIINGNGAYALSNFTKPPSAEANGAAAVLFFQDGNASNNRDVIIFDGNDSNEPSAFDAGGWSAPLNGVPYVSGTARLTLFVTDGQNLAGGDGTLRVNGTALGSGGLFQGNSLPGGSGPLGNGNLFDIATFDITGLLAPGVNHLSLTLSPRINDAVGLVGAFIDLRAGTIPSNGVPEPGSVALLGSILAGIGWLHRRRPRLALRRFRGEASTG